MNRLCYNSGKISGLSDYYIKKKFAVSSNKIAILGLVPINPTISIRTSWTIHMILDLIILTFCHYIYMQKDWTTSRGAIIEHKWAKRLGKKILYER